MVALHHETSMHRSAGLGRLWQFLGRIYQEFSEDRIPAVAAGITFFFLLALFPAIASIVSLYGLFADRHSIIEALRILSGFLPEGATRVLRNDIYRLITQKQDDLGWAFLVSFIIALWSASGGVKALLDGLNIAFEAKETRSFLHITINALIFTAVGAVAAVGGIYGVVMLSKALAALGNPPLLTSLVAILAWPIGFFICSALISLVYHIGPNRPHTPWRWITWGSGFAAVAWLAGTMLFSWYVGHYGRYDRTYGDLGAAVGFLTWVWLSLVIVLTGAEIVSETERE